MVYPSDDTPNPPSPKNSHSTSKMHDVIVPCYLRIRIPAEDDLEAEVAAVHALRKLGPIQTPCGNTAVLHSIISPIVNHPGVPS